MPTSCLEALRSASYETPRVFPALLETQGFTDTITRKKRFGKKEVTEAVRICDLEYKMVWKPVFEEDPNAKSLTDETVLPRFSVAILLTDRLLIPVQSQRTRKRCL
ncbi:MAG: hypothetical protein ABSA92_13900 [Candidatus Bathyarchaeia archaeon]